MYEHVNWSSSASSLFSDSFAASSPAALGGRSSRIIISSSLSLCEAFGFDSASLRVFFEPLWSRHNIVMPDSWPYTTISERVVARDVRERG